MLHVRTSAATRRWIAVVAVVVAGAGAAASPAGADVVSGSKAGSEQREWFDAPFDTQPRFFGKVRGRVRFVTDTTARLDSERSLVAADQGRLDAGDDVDTSLRNEAVSSRLRVTARPALQMLVEWQPHDNAYECANDPYPAFADDRWFMRTDDGGPVRDGFCGAIEVTADDLDELGDVLELPEVLFLVDRYFDPGYAGTRTLGHSGQVLEIKVCKIVTRLFGAPIGDRCDLQLDAQAEVPVTTLAQTLGAQMCTAGALDGREVRCLSPFGPLHAVTYAGPSRDLSAKAPCPTTPTEVAVRAIAPVWDARVERVDVGLTLDLNVHLRADGDGADLLDVPLPGSIALLTAPLGLRVEHSGAVLHVGDLATDDDPPSVVLSPSSVTIDEGSTATLTPQASDLCTAAEDLVSTWAIDGSTVTTPSLTRTYLDDNPSGRHAGVLTVADERGNRSAPHPFEITVRNVAPSIGLEAPADPVAVGTPARFRAAVTDPGSDVMTWLWSFGDGTTLGRTALDVRDRADVRDHTFVRPGEHTVRVAVGDGTDTRTADATVVAFDPSARLGGTSTFTADEASTGVPRGSSFRVSANVAYPRGAVRPAGTFRSSLLLVRPTGGSRPAGFEATSFEWLFDDPGASRLKGSGALDGQPGWTFVAETTRDSRSPRTSRLTISLWRPGATTQAAPDHRVSGARDTGNLH